MRFTTVSLLSLATILPCPTSAFTPSGFASSRIFSTELNVAESISTLNEAPSVDVALNVQDHSTLQEEDDEDDDDDDAPTSPIPKTKQNGPKRSAMKPNQDVNFLLKRTRQILAKERKTSTSNDVVKNLETFHWLIDAWAKSNHPNAPENALALYNAIQEYTNDNNGGIGSGPTIKTLTKVLNVFAKSGRGGDAAKAILEEYITGEDHDDCDGTHAMKPNVYTYTAILEAYACTTNPQPSFSNAFAAQNLCQWMETKNDPMIKPNARSYNAVIRSWGNCGDDAGAIKAEECLRRMERLYIKEQREAMKGEEAGVTSDGDDNDENDGRGDVVNVSVRPKPNIWNYNTVLNAWANRSVEGNAERAEALLNQMGQTMTEGDEDDRDTRSDDDNSLPLRPSPNTISYNVVIDAYAKNGEGEKAERLLRTMEDQYNTGQNTNSKPNTRSYNSVMNAHAKSVEKNGAVKAEHILRGMITAEGDNDSSVGVKPDFVSFATVINAWARSFEHGKAERALKLYREMVGLYEQGAKSMRPNVVIFNAIINACAYTIGDPSEQRQAMLIANTMFRELEASPFGKPDQITYGTFLKVCQNQMPNSEAKGQMVNVVFRKCAREGQVGQFVLDQMKTVASPKEFVALLGGASRTLILDDLPHEWRCNVVEGKRRRRITLL